ELRAVLRAGVLDLIHFTVIFSELRAALRAGVLNVISLLFLVNYALLSGQEYS
ncbi:hypothetical protein M9458_058084, partial [Cirrhinus mrigala]